MESTESKRNEYRVAVYGSLKAGHYNHGYLHAASYLGRFRTKPVYTLIDLGRYPAIIPHGSTAVEVEVYAVDSDTLMALDELEEHPERYVRTPIDLAGMKVFIYVLTQKGLEAFKNRETKVIRSGRWAG